MLLSNKSKKWKIRIVGCQPVFFTIWCEYTVIFWIRVIFGRLPLFSLVTPYLFPLILTITLLLCGRYIISKISLIDIIILIFGLSLWFSQKHFHPEYLDSFETYELDFLLAFATFFVARIVASEGFTTEFYYSLYRLSVIGIGFTSLYLLFGKTKDTVGGMMSTAYFILPSILCAITICLDNPTPRRRVFFLVCIVMTVLMGTRGVLLATLIFTCLFYLVFRELTPKRAIIIGFIVTTTFIVASLVDYRLVIYKLLTPLAKLLNLSSRILDGLLTGAVFNDNGRRAFQEIIWEKILMNPFGYGLFSDRYITGTRINYVHNIVLELWAEFGIFLGSIPILFIVICTIILIKRANTTRESKYIILIFLCSAIIKLLFSGTWITERYFYMLLGILTGLLVKKKKRNKYTTI